MQSIDPTAADPIRIASDGLTVEVSPIGAELQSIRDAQGRDLLWNGDPAWWTGRAPILFPVIGMLAGGGYHLDGEFRAMPKHGFARTAHFVVAAVAADMVVMRLTDTAGTRAIWPFPFVLDILFAVAGATLSMEAAICNPGDRTMPASFGFHPAFRWPLPDGGPREATRVRFAEAEPAPIRRIGKDGLLLAQPQPTPVERDTLTPRDDLFDADALMFDDLRSRSLHYGAPGERGLDIAFDLPYLGIWTKPGAPYLAIEPWQGINDPAGFTGDIRTKPGIVEIAPGETRRFHMDVTLTDAGAA